MSSECQVAADWLAERGMFPGAVQALREIESLRGRMPPVEQGQPFRFIHRRDNSTLEFEAWADQVEFDLTGERLSIDAFISSIRDEVRHVRHGLPEQAPITFEDTGWPRTTPHGRR